MNEQIYKIARQADALARERVPDLREIVLYDRIRDEKFAELIVRECLDIALEVRGEPATDTHYVIGYDRACEKMISGIREHFGVEE